VQIGLLAAEPVVPMTELIARELTVFGAHGLAAGDYPELMALVSSGALRPQDIVDRRIRLADVPSAMEAMARGELPGVTVVELD
jgi:alcohol dehydrogenase